MSQAQPFTGDLPDWKPGLRNQLKIGGRFLLLDEAGHGSAGLVYKARDTWSETLVALKVLKGSAAMQPRLAAGFRREIEIGRQISHPHVVSFLASGVHDGWTYLAMEFVGGRTLAELLALNPRMPLDEFEPLCWQLLSALECIHGAGIVHRDVKPSNLMLAADGNWKLMDFGISRVNESIATVGPALGTPQYMSPEQMLSDPATPQSDLYSAGVVLFEALTGRSPFFDFSLQTRCTQIPTRVSAFRPTVPPWLDAMIARCLSINPKERYASAAEMRSQLGRFEEVAAPATAPPPVEPSPEPAFLDPPRPPELPVLRDYLTDSPGKPEDVLAMFLEVLRALQARAMRGEAADPLTPDSVHRAPSGRIEIGGIKQSGKRDTLMVANPKYAAPELLHGPSSPSGPGWIPAQVYSVGFMLYEFLLGRTQFARQFPGMEDLGTGLAWMEWHSDPAKRLRPLTELVPGTPVAVSELVARMTAKDPAQRCAAYEEAIATIQSLVTRTKVTQEIAAIPAKAPSAAVPLTQRAWVVAGVTMLLLLAALAAGVWFLRR